MLSRPRPTVTATTDRHLKLPSPDLPCDGEPEPTANIRLHNAPEHSRTCHALEGPGGGQPALPHSYTLRGKHAMDNDGGM